MPGHKILQKTGWKHKNQLPETEFKEFNPVNAGGSESMYSLASPPLEKGFNE